MSVINITLQQCKVQPNTHTDKMCVEGTLRLVGGPTIKEGRVQLCYNRMWHSVCGDRWSEMGSEADVVCSALGYTSTELGKEAT